MTWQSRLIPEPNTGCLLWDGAVTVDGYPVVRIGGRAGRTCRVHRLAWEAVHGPIPDRAVVRHSCGVLACCNPAHLFLGERRIGQRGPSLRARQTHCLRGHEYTPENTLIYQGSRTCRACNRARARAWYYAHKETKEAPAYA